MSKAVTKDMIIRDILALDAGVSGILMRTGMHCVGCPSASGETLEEASLVHGINIDKLVDDINAYLKDK